MNIFEKLFKKKADTLTAEVNNINVKLDDITQSLINITNEETGRIYLLKEELINKIFHYGNKKRDYGHIFFEGQQEEVDNMIKYIKEIIDELCKDANNVRPEKPCSKCTCESCS